MFLFRFLAIILLIIFGVTYISRLVLRQFIRKMGGDAHNQSQRKTRPEGEVHVSTQQQKEKIVDKNVGEYVDYEELD